MSSVPLLLAVAAAVVVGERGRRRRIAHDPGRVRSVNAAAARGSAGLAALLVALLPPIDALAHGSFAWHMAQHQLLLLVVAPLVASSEPLVTLRHALGWSSARTGDRSDGDVPGLVVVLAGVLAVTTLFVWHLPTTYDAALSSLRIHQLEHATLLATATFLWGAVLAAARDDRIFAAVAVLAMTAISGAGLGVVLLTSDAPLYAYGAGDVALEAQQLGGALMKVGALLVHAGAAVWLFVRWLGGLEARSTPLPTRVAAAGHRDDD